MHWTACVSSAVLLMAETDLYKNHTVADLKRTLFPPVKLGQYRIYLKSGKPHAFVSWAYLSPEVREGFISRTRQLQPEDWNSGDELWFINFIAPYGGVRSIIRDLYKIHPNAVGYTSRTYGTGEVQRVGKFNNVSKDVD